MIPINPRLVSFPFFSFELLSLRLEKCVIIKGVDSVSPVYSGELALFPHLQTESLECYPCRIELPRMHSIEKSHTIFLQTLPNVSALTCHFFHLTFQDNALLCEKLYKVLQSFLSIFWVYIIFFQYFILYFFQRSS